MLTIMILTLAITAQDSPERHVRATEAPILALINTGLSRSATFRRLVTTLQIPLDRNANKSAISLSARLLTLGIAVIGPVTLCRERFSDTPNRKNLLTENLIDRSVYRFSFTTTFLEGRSLCPWASRSTPGVSYPSRSVPRSPRVQLTAPPADGTNWYRSVWA